MGKSKKQEQSDSIWKGILVEIEAKPQVQILEEWKDRIETTALTA